VLSRNNVVAIAAAISPYKSIRDEIRAKIENFVEVYVDVPLEEAIKRDVKGLYEKALRGEITNFTGVSDPYEPPENPEVVCHTAEESVGESVAKIMRALEARDLLP